MDPKNIDNAFLIKEEDDSILDDISEGETVVEFEESILENDDNMCIFLSEFGTDNYLKKIVETLQGDKASAVEALGIIDTIELRTDSQYLRDRLQKVKDTVLKTLGDSNVNPNQEVISLISDSSEQEFNLNENSVTGRSVIFKDLQVVLKRIQLEDIHPIHHLKENNPDDVLKKSPKTHDGEHSKNISSQERIKNHSSSKRKHEHEKSSKKSVDEKHQHQKHTKGHFSGKRKESEKTRNKDRKSSKEQISSPSSSFSSDSDILPERKPRKVRPLIQSDEESIYPTNKEIVITSTDNNKWSNVGLALDINQNETNQVSLNEALTIEPQINYTNNEIINESIPQLKSKLSENATSPRSKMDSAYYEDVMDENSLKQSKLFDAKIITTNYKEIISTTGELVLFLIVYSSSAYDFENKVKMYKCTKYFREDITFMDQRRKDLSKKLQKYFTNIYINNFNVELMGQHYCNYFQIEHNAYFECVPFLKTFKELLTGGFGFCLVICKLIDVHFEQQETLTVRNNLPFTKQQWIMYEYQCNIYKKFWEGLRVLTKDSGEKASPNELIHKKGDTIGASD